MIKKSTLSKKNPNDPVTHGEFSDFKSEMYEFKAEMYEFKDYVYRSLDHMTEILERLDQERIFTDEGFRRSDTTLINHEQRITHLETATLN